MPDKSCYSEWADIISWDSILWPDNNILMNIEKILESVQNCGFVEIMKIYN